MKGPPLFRVIDDSLHPCAYRPGEQARQPMRLALGPIGPTAFDALLAAGDRRAGPFQYRASCPTCQACEPLRVPTREFTPSRSQRKVLQRNADLVVEYGPAIADEERVSLYNRHKNERGLERGEGPLSVEDYAGYYVRSGLDTLEVRYRLEGRLIALSIVDVGARAMSSVYHAFDPAESRRSLGVFSVCREIALCADWGLDWYYLGLWVADCPSLVYKSQYRPHERLRQGLWQRES